MSMEIPLTFKMDQYANIADAVNCDPGSAMSDIIQGFYHTQLGGVVQSAADLLIPGLATDIETYRYKAFTDAGAVACTGFMESDLDEELRELTFKNLTICGAPLNLLKNSHKATFLAFQEFANKGLDNHWEMSGIVDKLEDYFRETSHDPVTGIYARCGAGFIVGQLERSWQSTRQIMIEKICLDESKDIDWDKLFN